MDESFNKNKLAGNNAENIVEFLVNSMPDWKCNKFGVETHIKDIKDMVGKVVNPITTKIRKMPDFIAFNTKTGETHLIEVKTRSKFINYSTNKPEYHIKFLEEYKIYWPGTKLIMLQGYKPYIFVVDLDKIDRSMKRKVEGTGFYWNFEEIKKNIKDIFPELDNKIIEEAIKKIPKEED